MSLGDGNVAARSVAFDSVLEVEPTPELNGLLVGRQSGEPGSRVVVAGCAGKSRRRSWKRALTYVRYLWLPVMIT
ncbi:hypothetical protein J6590_009703 [Homalodisca vitripennis]|nr:hypothetical protein J6590_009703 [Homalodisca vitripennis]